LRDVEIVLSAILNNSAAGQEIGPILRVSNLGKAFGQHEVLRDINLDIAAGSVVSIIGASGSGKSTLLRCLNHLEQPTAGEVFLNGEPMGFRIKSDGRRVADNATLERMRAQIAPSNSHSRKRR
jgi:polar amino acid transport system ATP-binding protein